MAQFQYSLPPELLDQLARDLVEVQRAQVPSERYFNPATQKHYEVGGLPLYPEFVQHLMKSMPTPEDELIHAAVGMSGESGETLDLAKKVWVYRKELDAAALVKELGDVRFYYQALLNFLGITDEMVKAHNIVKLRKRYADGKYSDSQAIAQADKPALGEARGRDAAPLERRFMGRKEER